MGHGGARVGASCAARRVILGGGLALALAATGSHGALAEERRPLVAGALAVTAPAEVELRGATITITPDDVSGRYLFRNPTRRDASAMASFAAPDLDASDGGVGYLALPAVDALNFLGFSASVDGGPVKPMTEHFAFGAGLERTRVLDDAGVPANPGGEPAWRALRALSPQVQEDLRVAGLIDFQKIGDQKEPRPRWLLKTAHYWPQVFPAGKDVTIAWRYLASTGVRLAPRDAAPARTSSSEGPASRRACMAAAFAEVASAARKRGDEAAWLLERTVKFNPAMAVAWAGATVKPTIIIETGSPDVLVATCTPGLTKTGPTSWSAPLNAQGGVLTVSFIGPAPPSGLSSPPPEDEDMTESD